MQTEITTPPVVGAMPAYPIHPAPTLAFSMAETLIEARCEQCNDAVCASKSELQVYGWYLGRGEQFCPRCNTFA